jgi:3-oxoadipate enol-lactonase
MPFASSKNCRLYYRLEGSPAKPPLVMVHSLGTDHGLWDLQLPALLPHFKVLRLDVRGHGASDSTPGDYTIDLLASDVLACADACGLTRFAYCGLSLGGMIGQWLGAHYPDRPTRLVLANTSPRMADPTAFDNRRGIVMNQGMAGIEDAVMQRFFSPATLASENPLVESTRSALLSAQPVGYAGCCAAIRDMDQRPSLPSIQTPTLVIAGDIDLSTPWPGHGDLLANTIPGAQSVLLHAAHLSNIEQPTAFNQALLQFLKPA